MPAPDPPTTPGPKKQRYRRRKPVLSLPHAVTPVVKEHALRMVVAGHSYVAAGMFAEVGHKTVEKWMKALPAADKARYAQEASAALAATVHRERLGRTHEKALARIDKGLDDPKSSLRDCVWAYKVVTETIRTLPCFEVPAEMEDRIRMVQDAVFRKALAGDTKALEIATKYDPQYRGDAPAVQINIAQIEAMTQDERLKQISFLLDRAKQP